MTYQPVLIPTSADTINAGPTPTQTACPSCGAPVIAALEGRVGLPVAADPVSLTPLGELQALTAGLRTFEHWHDGLGRRSAWLISRCPAGRDQAANPIRPEHRCDGPPLDCQPAPTRPDLPPDDAPPY